MADSEIFQRIALVGMRRGLGVLPQPLRTPTERTLDKLLYARNTRGVAENPRWRSWALAYGKPVTIVIPSYNDFELLKVCLDSIAETAGHLDYRVIIVDDYAQEENRERLKTLASDRVELILKPEREGFARAVNRGLAAVPDDRDLVVLNSDIVTLPGWLDALMASAYTIDPRVGLVSGRLIYPNGRIQYGGTYYARVLAPQWFGHMYVGRSPRDAVTGVGGYNRSVSGACTYITRDAYAKLGGLHEDYWLGFEDVDWGLTAWQQGIRCYYQPDALAIHHESASRGYSQGARELASMRLFWRRWESQFLRREIAEPFEVDFLMSERADAVWRRYVETTVARLTERGVTATVHEVPAELVDEDVVARLEPRDSIKVCCDWGAQVTTWLASLTHGKPIYLLPGREAATYPPNAPERARIAAGYRPEFDYIAPDRLTAHLLTKQSAWEVQHRVVPTLAPAASAALVGSAAASGAPASVAPVIVLGGGPEQIAAVQAVATKHGRELVHLDDPRGSVAALDTLAGSAAVAVVSFVTDASSALPLFAMSRGAVVIAPAEEQTKYEVLDGYNALTFDAAGGAASAVDGVLADPQVAAELVGNGLRTVDALYDRNLDDLLAAFRHAARTAV